MARIIKIEGDSYTVQMKSGRVSSFRRGNFDYVNPTVGDDVTVTLDQVENERITLNHRAGEEAKPTAGEPRPTEKDANVPSKHGLEPDGRPVPSAPSTAKTAVAARPARQSPVKDTRDNKQSGNGKRPFYQRTWFLVLMIFLFPAVGLVLLFVPTFRKRFKRGAWIALLAMAAVFVLFRAIILFTPTSSSSSNTNTTASQPTAESQSEPANDAATEQQPDSNGSNTTSADDASSGEPSDPGVTGVTPTDREAQKANDISQFDYELSGGKVVLKEYKGDAHTLEIRASYVVDGREYPTDMTHFDGGLIGATPTTVILDEGITEVANATFNSSRVNRVYFPSTMRVVYDRTLTYFNPGKGGTIDVYYGGSQSQWDSIFTVYHSPSPDEIADDDWESKGAAFADRLNNAIGAYDYDPDEYAFHFNASPDDLR